jgi:hypothetical protein
VDIETAFPAHGEAAELVQQRGMGRPRGEVPGGQVLFRAASRRTGLDGFPIIRLSSDYCVRGAVGRPEWIWLWQAVQTTRVLRRRLAMIVIHSGCCGPGWVSSARVRTWCV